MTEQPPRRLLEDPGVAAQVRRDLANARAQSAAYDLSAGLQALKTKLDDVEAGSQVEPGTSFADEVEVSATQGAEWSESLRSIAGKWWGLCAVGLATVGAMWWAQHEEPPLQSRAGGANEQAPAQIEFAEAAPKPVEMLPEPAQSGSQPRARAKETTRRVGAGSTPAARTAASRARFATRSTATDAEREGAAAHANAAAEAQRADVRPSQDVDAPPAQVSAPRAASASAQPSQVPEVEHLARVRRLLATQPQEALAAAREGQRLFAAGVFTEERAGLIVFALARLERKDEALRAGRQFLHAYPGGPFAARVREIVERLERARP